MKVYAEIGQSLQQIDGDCPEGWVIMTSQRPELNYVASEDGSWVVPPKPVPQVVSRFQGREAMWQTVYEDRPLFVAVEELLNEPTTPATYRRAWAELQEFRRDSEMLAAIATQLGLTIKQVDDLFILAANIVA